TAARGDAAGRGRASLYPRLGALYRIARHDNRDADLWRFGAAEGTTGQIRIYRRKRLCGSSAAAGAQGVAVMANPLRTLNEFGQSVWLDFVSRDLLKSVGLAQLIPQGGLPRGPSH